MSDLRALARRQLRSMAAYDPGPSLAELAARYGVDHIVKLNWNEDLFGLLPGVEEAVIEELKKAPLYPEQAYSDFRRLVADFIGADPAMVLPAHGIQALVLSSVAVFVDPGDRVVLPHPTYGLYRQACEAAGAVVVTVPTSGYRFDLEEMARASEGARLVFVCDPNNPTGDALDAAEWTSFLDSLPPGCLAVVDEAYADYMAPADRVGRVADVAAGRRLVVLRTFSKLFGIAGLRLGFAMVHPDLVPCYDAVQEPFNVNRLALAAGTACLSNPSAIEARRLEVVAARQAFASSLAELGIPSWPSQANFVLAEPGGDDVAWYEGLVRRRFLVRPGSEFGLAGHLRITVGPQDLMTSVAAAMAEVGGELRPGPHEDDVGAPNGTIPAKEAAR
jgi:histidinol-phosphate aminotransferase